MTACWSCEDAAAVIIHEGALVCARCAPVEPLDIPEFCKAAA
jgi:hypothetical protein